MKNNTVEKVIIIGSGPAAHTAAIYAGRAEMSPLLFEGFMAGGVAAGGQLTTTSEVENFPGFSDPIPGPELMQQMRAQTLRCGARILTETVESVDLSSSPFSVTTTSQTVQTKSLIIATGATAKRMGVEGEEQYWQKGISACAICDGALPIFRDKDLVVIGGGDAACEEAHYLTKFGKSVSMVVRRDVLRASKVMQERVRSHPKIQIFWHTVLKKAIGDELLSGVLLYDKKEDRSFELPVGGLFYAIGHSPNTGFLGGQLELDTTGYIQTHDNVHTGVPGVFACGDVQDKRYRQAITAAGSGCMAALEAERVLNEQSS